MMPAVQISSGPGMALAAGRGSGVRAGNESAPGGPGGTELGAAMQHALSQVSGREPGRGNGAGQPVDGGSNTAGWSAAAGAGGNQQAPDARQGIAGSGTAPVDSHNVTLSVSNAKSHGGADTAEHPGLPAQGGTAATAKAAEALAGSAQTVVQPTAARAGGNVTNVSTNPGEAVSEGAGAAGSSQGVPGTASEKAGQKADGKKAGKKSHPVQPAGQVANGSVMLAAAASAVAGAHPAAAPARVIAGATATAYGRTVAAVVSVKAGPDAGAGNQGLASAAGIANAGRNAQVAAAGPIQSQSQSEGRTQGSLVTAAAGVGVSSGSAPLGVGADTGSGVNASVSASADAGGSTGGNAAGGAGLTASRGRDGARNASGANGNASPGGGFMATLLQAHAGDGLATGSGVGPGVSAGVGTGPVIAAGPHGSVQHAAGNAVGMGAANPYARMDEPQRATLVYASPQKMSVAVSDPGLGNFQVRAHGEAAQVVASLATSSAVTHAQLSGHLPALTAFLQDQHVDVSRVTVVQQSLPAGDAGPRDFGGQQRQGDSGGRGARAQAGRVGGVEAGGAGGLQGTVSSAGTAGAEAGLDLGRDDAAGASTRRAAALDGGVMSSVDVHA